MTAIAAVLATYPNWGARVGNSDVLSAVRDPSATIVTLNVSGMTCDACAGEIEHELQQVPGVLQASVDYEQARAAIVIAGTFEDPSQLVAAVEKAGYHATASGRSPSTAQPTSKLAGQWRGRLSISEEKETSDLVVDLDRVDGRWTGQFDLPDVGVEDYPVEVTFSGLGVTLQLTAAQIEFIGELKPGNVLVGVAEVHGHRDSLFLRRVSGAQLSEEFLRLEALSGDSTRVQSLSANGAELRKAFNEDRSYTRLVMLLSPT